MNGAVPRAPVDKRPHLWMHGSPAIPTLPYPVIPAKPGPSGRSPAVPESATRSRPRTRKVGGGLTRSTGMRRFFRGLPASRGVRGHTTGTDAGTRYRICSDGVPVFDIMKLDRVLHFLAPALSSVHAGPVNLDFPGR
ncbi:hypothetical protein GCM10009116_19290 [Brevundimonas basaltis]